VSQDASIHDPPPQWRYQGKQYHSGVSRGHLRCIVEVPQKLVSALRSGVVIGIALQVYQEIISDCV
jgi:hypothetical protein